ncbi:MAG: Uma2 family endonuclease [Gemmataceae bacterium]|nr:Uma2 family endonuclease [Gemmataceae bacterium]
MTALSIAPAPAGQPEPYRFSVDQYHAMIRSGIIPEGGAFQLIRGVVVTKISKDPSHRRVTFCLGEALRPLLPPAFALQTQEPITLADSEPEPGQSVCRRDTILAGDRHPGPADVPLVAEVADSSLHEDRTSQKERVHSQAVATSVMPQLLDLKAVAAQGA